MLLKQHERLPSLLSFHQRARDVLFQEKKQELSPDGPGVRMLCPTQWTVCGDSLDSVL